MKSFLIGTLLVVCILVAGVFAFSEKFSTTAPSPATATTVVNQTYSLERVDGSIITASVGSTGVAVIFSFKETSTGYMGPVINSSGVSVLSKTGSFGTSSATSTLQVSVTSISNTSLSIQIVDPQTASEDEVATLTLAADSADALGDDPERAGGGGYHCHNAQGTGQCDHVVTDNDWQRCFWCCFFLGCPTAT